MKTIPGKLYAARGEDRNLEENCQVLRKHKTVENRTNWKKFFRRKKKKKHMSPASPTPPLHFEPRQSCYSCWRYVDSSYSTYLSSKYCEGYSSYRADKKSNSNKRRGNNSKSKKARVVILVHNTSSRPVLHFYQVSSKYAVGYSCYRADKK